MFDYSDLREKVEKLWLWTWRICMWTILFASLAMAGYHASPKQVYPQIVKCR